MPTPLQDPPLAHRDAQIDYMLAVDRLIDAAKRAEQERDRFLRLVREQMTQQEQREVAHR